MPGRGQLTDGAWREMKPLPLLGGGAGGGATAGRPLMEPRGSCGRGRRGRDLFGRWGPWQTCYDPGQRHDGTQLEVVLDAIRVPRSGGVGWPRKKLDRVIADKGYQLPGVPTVPAAARHPAHYMHDHITEQTS